MRIRDKYLRRERPASDRYWMSSYSRGWTRNEIEDVTRITSQTSDCLILECRPSDIPKTHYWAIFWWFCYWVPFGLCPIAFVIFWLMSSQRDSGERVLLIGFLIAAIISISTSLSSLLKAKVKTFILDKTSGELTLIAQSFRQEKILKYSLKDFQGAIVEASPRPQNLEAFRYSCRIILLMDDGRRIPLTAAKQLPGIPDEETLADTVNHFLKA